VGMQRDPFVVMDPLGDFLVTWQDESGTDGDGFGVFARAFNADGTPKGPQFQISQTSAGDQSDPHAAVDYVGNYLVSWQDDDGADIDAMARRFASDGTPQSDEFGLHESKPFDQVEPKVVMTQSGERIAASWFDTVSDSYARVFELPLIAPDSSLTIGQTTLLNLDFPGTEGQTYVLPMSFTKSNIVAVPVKRKLGLFPADLFCRWPRRTVRCTTGWRARWGWTGRRPRPFTCPTIRARWASRCTSWG